MPFVLAAVNAWYREPTEEELLSFYEEGNREIPMPAIREIHAFILVKMEIIHRDTKIYETYGDARRDIKRYRAQLSVARVKGFKKIMPIDSMSL
jgi:hypothetical protein